MTPAQVADDVATELISHTEFSYDGPFHRRLVAAIEAQIIAAYNQGLEDVAELAQAHTVGWSSDPGYIVTDTSSNEKQITLAAAIREKKIKP